MDQSNTAPPPQHQPFGKVIAEALDQAVTHAAVGFLRRRGYQVTPPSERFVGKE